MRRLFAFSRDLIGDLPSLRAAFPDAMAPLVRMVGGERELYEFLTTEANGAVGPVHPNAMPVLLKTAEEFATWLEAPWAELESLQRPLPDGMMRIVAIGTKHDAHADP